MRVRVPQRYLPLLLAVQSSQGFQSAQPGNAPSSKVFFQSHQGDNAWMLTLGLSLVLALSPPDASSTNIFDPFDFTAPPYVEAPRSKVYQEKAVPDEGALLRQITTGKQSSAPVSASAALGETHRQNAIWESSEVSLASPKKSASLALLGKFAVVPDEGDFVPPSILRRSTTVSNPTEPKSIYPKTVKASPVPSVVAKAASSSSEVTAAPRMNQPVDSKTTMASLMGQQKQSIQATVPDEGDFLPKSFLAARGRPMDQKKVYPKVAQSAPVPQAIARAASTSSEVTPAPSKAEQQTTKNTMASILGQQEASAPSNRYVPDESDLVSPPSTWNRRNTQTTKASKVMAAARSSSEVSPALSNSKSKTSMATLSGQVNKKVTRTSVPDEADFLSPSILAAAAKTKQSEPVVRNTPRTTAGAPVPPMIARAAATSSEVSTAPQSSKTAMASLAGNKQETNKHLVEVPDEFELVQRAKKEPTGSWFYF